MDAPKIVIGFGVAVGVVGVFGVAVFAIVATTVLAVVVALLAMDGDQFPSRKGRVNVPEAIFSRMALGIFYPLGYV